MRFTIFREGDNKVRSDRHRAIHFVWKRKLFYPLMTILNKYIKKFLIKSIDDIPNEAYNRNFRILYYSIEKGTEDWYYNFYGGIKNGVKDPARYEWLEQRWPNRERHHWHKIPRWFTNLLVTICLEDTAYRELMNCIMMRLQGEMNKSWNPEIQHRFPLYISMHDGLMPFFIEWLRIQGGGQIKIESNPLDIQLKIKGNQKISLNKEAVELIYKLNKNDHERFMLYLNKFIIHMLGRERLRNCPGCKKLIPLSKFRRSGTADYIFCDECAIIKANGTCQAITSTGNN